MSSLHLISFVAVHKFIFVWIIILFVSIPLSPLLAEDKQLPVEGEVFKIKGRVAFLILPKEKDDKKLIPWVWYAPTLKNLPAKEEEWMFKKFLEKGIAIAGIDIGESYGNEAGRTLYTEFYNHLIEKRGLKKKACLLARSRGGLMLYNWAVENPLKVKCIAGIYPVSNIISYPGLARACGVYGLTKEELSAEVKKHNPIDRLAPLAEAKVPIFHIHGDKDKLVPLEENSAKLSERYKALGGSMVLKTFEGQGHSMWKGWFQCQELVDFLTSNAIEKKADKKKNIPVKK